MGRSISTRQERKRETQTDREWIKTRGGETETSKTDRHRDRQNERQTMSGSTTKQTRHTETGQ